MHVGASVHLVMHVGAPRDPAVSVVSSIGVNLVYKKKLPERQRREVFYVVSQNAATRLLHVASAKHDTDNDQPRREIGEERGRTSF